MKHVALLAPSRNSEGHKRAVLIPSTSCSFHSVDRWVHLDAGTLWLMSDRSCG